jgi:hypothetical protein
MAFISSQTVYENLPLLEQSDVITAALHRQSAQDILANPINLYDILA